MPNGSCHPTDLSGIAKLETEATLWHQCQKVFGKHPRLLSFVGVDNSYRMDWNAVIVTSELFPIHYHVCGHRYSIYIGKHCYQYEQILLVNGGSEFDIVHSTQKTIIAISHALLNNERFCLQKEYGSCRGPNCVSFYEQLVKIFQDGN